MKNRYSQRKKLPLSNGQRKIFEMLEFMLDYCPTGLLCFLFDNIDAPTWSDITQMIKFKYGNAEITSNKSKTNAVNRPQELVMLSAQKVEEPIQMCGGIEKIRTVFGTIRESEGKKCNERPGRINDFELLVAFSRFGGVGEYENITSYSRYYGYEIRTLIEHRNNILKSAARDLYAEQKTTEENKECLKK